MSLLDKLTGREPEPQPAPAPATTNEGSTTDEQAVSRYRYMLKTAPPETIEQAHREAFERLTPEQRKLALQKLSEAVPPEERPESDDPQALARTATRAEVRQPGALSGGGGVGLGGIIGGSLLGSLAGSFIGSAIANSFFSNPMHAQDYNAFAQQNGTDDNVANDANGATEGTEAANETPAAETAAEPDPLGDPADAGALDDSGFGGDALGDLEF